MSGGGGKGGSQTSETQIPQFIEDASRANLARADEISQIGYTPFFGPDVAAFTPMQQASFANTGSAADAFGLSGGGMTGMEGMPQAQDFNGVSGFSSAPIFQGALDQLQAQRPGQFNAIMDQFIDPVTGAASGGAMQAQPQMPMPMQSSGGGGAGNRATMPTGGGGAGFTSFNDMFDGGGAGMAGDTFQGGGRLSNVGNMVASPRGSGGGSSSGMGGGK